MTTPRSVPLRELRQRRETAADAITHMSWMAMASAALGAFALLAWVLQGEIPAGYRRELFRRAPRDGPRGVEHWSRPESVERVGPDDIVRPQPRRFAHPHV